MKDAGLPVSNEAVQVWVFNALLPANRWTPVVCFFLFSITSPLIALVNCDKKSARSPCLKRTGEGGKHRSRCFRPFSNRRLNCKKTVADELRIGKKNPPDTVTISTLC